MIHPSLRLIAVGVLLGACSAGSDGIPAGQHPAPGTGGKADDYVSTNAREFELTGHAHLTLPDGFGELSEEDRAARLDQLVQSRLSVVSRSIQSHIADLLREENGGETGEDTRFFTYMRRNAAEAEPAEVREDGRARFPFSIMLVGSYYLMSVVAPGEAEHRTFEVEVKDWSETEGERVTVEIAGSESRDAFPRYDQLFADGVYDLAVHFGGDYNEERFDLDTARWLVEALIEDGWTNEAVTSFEELAIDSPPFTRTVTVEGREIEARVYIYHSDMVTPDQEELLSEAMRNSFATRDVVLYSGHAGEGAGFILDYQPRHEIPARDFATLPMRDDYQIFVFDGCRTYRTYVDDMLKNEAKTFANMDIVTTVNTTPFSVGYQTIHELVYWLTITDPDGRHFPLSWNTILRGLNTRSFRSVHYGVHGVDHDPRLNPHGSEGIMCRTCETDADCGAGGNLCLGFPGGAACGVACTTDTACGEGFRCARIYDLEEYFYIPKQCVPRDLTCG